MTKGLSNTECMVIVAMVAIMIAIAVGQCKWPVKSEPIRPAGTAEATAEFPAGQQIDKVGPWQLEAWLSANRRRIVSICPVLEGEGQTLEVTHYLVVTENAAKAGPIVPEKAP